MSDCQTWEVAVVRRNESGPSEWHEWLTTPPEIHVSNDLLNNHDARAFLSTRYELCEPCPRMPGVTHARLCPTPDPAARSHPDAQTAQIAEEAP